MCIDSTRTLQPSCMILPESNHSYGKNKQASIESQDVREIEAKTEGSWNIEIKRGKE